MTNEYKERLLDWLCGSYTTGTGLNEPQFSNVETVYYSFKTVLSGYLTYNTYIIIRNYIRSSRTDNYLIYGYGYDDDNNISPFIAIIDNNFEITEVLVEFESGTPLYQFNYLTYTGDGSLIGTTIDKFVMLNDILADSDNYYVEIKKSYNLDTTLVPSGMNVGMIYKSDGSADYYIIGVARDTTKLSVLHLTINVGSPNEWELANTTTISDAYTSYFQNGETPQIYLYGFIGTTIYRLLYSENTITTDNTFSLSIYEINDLYSYNNGKLFITGQEKTGTTYDLNVYAYDYLTGTYDTINIETRNDNTPFDIFRDKYEIINNNIFFYIYFNGVNIGPFGTYNYFGLIDNNTYYNPNKNIAYSHLYTELDGIYFGIYNVYDFYKLNLQLPNFSSRSEVVYNFNNYNGASYQGLLSLYPTSARLYDDNSNLLFARNLYNLTLSNNTYNASVEVPNTLFNNLTIGQQELYSGTNSILVSNINDYTTNIYETLYFNFFNTINMVDSNDPTNIKNIIGGASRLVRSSTKEVDYDNSKLSKVRVNYSDGTNEVRTLQTDIVSTYVRQVWFNLYPLKEVISLDYLSNDLETTYISIPVSLDTDKLYKIEEYLKIE